MTPSLSPPTDVPFDSPESHLNRARSSLRQALNRYTAYFKVAKDRPLSPRYPILKQDMERLSVTLSKLETSIARIAVFGLVSRGKSAVLNALLGQKFFATGPLNGVTTEPRTVLWTAQAENDHAFAIELIDTPGLDEIEGEVRAEMADRIARQSDLILFIVSGDITRTEYEALCDLRRSQKPILLVFNKVDLYPDQSRQRIYQNLQQLSAKTAAGQDLQELLSANEIVLVAAEPAPLQVRVEQPDGKVTYEWENPVPQIQALKDKIAEVLNREGKSLLALNALVQTRDAEMTLTSELIDLRRTDAEALIWKYMRYKAIAVAVNPIAVLDLVAGTATDIALIRALSDLYGLPITNHEAGNLWKQIIVSSGGLLVGEWLSALAFGLGKTVSAVGMESSPGLTAFFGAGAVQGAIAGFGTYTVGRAIQVYLEQGCSWGPQGTNTIIQDILNQTDKTTILYRLRQELSQDLGLPIL